MPVPKKKKSRARRNNRRSHQHLAKQQVQKCSRCGSARMPHYVCKSCGFYGETEVIRPREDDTMEETK